MVFSNVFVLIHRGRHILFFLLEGNESLKTNGDAMPHGRLVVLGRCELPNVASALGDDGAHGAGAVPQDVAQTAQRARLHLDVHNLDGLVRGGVLDLDLAEAINEVGDAHVGSDATDAAALAAVETTARRGDASDHLATGSNVLGGGLDGADDLGVGLGDVRAHLRERRRLEGLRQAAEVLTVCVLNVVVRARVVHADRVAGHGERPDDDVGLGSGAAARTDADEDNLWDGVLRAPRLRLGVVLLQDVDLVHNDLDVVGAHAGGHDRDGDALVGAGHAANLAVGVVEAERTFVEALGDDGDTARVSNKHNAVGDVFGAGVDVVDAALVINWDFGV
eukprot:PhM_4_TR1665/c0_g1_i1/m.56341